MFCEHLGLEVLEGILCAGSLLLRRMERRQQLLLPRLQLGPRSVSEEHADMKGVGRPMVHELHKAKSS